MPVWATDAVSALAALVDVAVAVLVVVVVGRTLVD